MYENVHSVLNELWALLALWIDFPSEETPIRWYSALSDVFSLLHKWNFKKSTLDLSCVMLMQVTMKRCQRWLYNMIVRWVCAALCWQLVSCSSSLCLVCTRLKNTVVSVLNTGPGICQRFIRPVNQSDLSVGHAADDMQESAQSSWTWHCVSGLLQRWPLPHLSG